MRVLQTSSQIDDYRIRKLLLCLPGYAVRILFDRYYRLLVDMSFALTNDSEASRDIALDVFFQLWMEARTVAREREQTVEHYLLKLMRSKSRGHLRRKNLLHESVPEERKTEVLLFLAYLPRRARREVMTRLGWQKESRSLLSKLLDTLKYLVKWILMIRKRLSDYAGKKY
jgi:DNA-directed RNA polymerase specialized sigma24 family protein